MMEAQKDSKEKVDMSGFAEEKIAEGRRNYDATKNIEDVLELLLNAEKKCRLSNDSFATKAVAESIVALLRELKDWERLDGMLTMLAKRRSQSKAVVSAVLNAGIAAIDDDEDLKEVPEDGTVREKLLTTLSVITEGRMYCELERAKIARLLAQLKERKGDVDGASDVLQTVNAETYGSLSKREKVDFILEQVRLLLLKEDRVRAFVVSKKVQRKTIQDLELQDLKIRFYTLMIDFYAGEVDDDEAAPFDLAQAYYNVYDTPCVKDEPKLWKDALSSCALFLVLSDHSPMVQDMQYRVLQADKDKLKAIGKGEFYDLVNLFVKKEIIREPLNDQKIFETHDALTKHGPETQARWKMTLHRRIVQHNIRIVAKYYKQITLPRLANILQLTEDDAETHVAHMVSQSGLYCKIDRPAKIAKFAKPKPAEEILSDWASDISKMLNLVEMTCHLINKENMIHKIST